MSQSPDSRRARAVRESIAALRHAVLWAPNGAVNAVLTDEQQYNLDELLDALEKIKTPAKGGK